MSSDRHHQHNQGNQGCRDVTPEQLTAVKRIRACEPTAFYAILDLETVRTTCTESDIKKAYRKQSLLTHPDKNSHEHADEAFKMVSRAFSVLSDKDKRDQYDRFGGDPDSRFAAGGGGGDGAGGFPGFSQRGRFAHQGFGEEITPEEIFRQFFGGGFGGGGMNFGGFDTGPQFMFNFGGGPGIRVHQFGGRPRATQQQQQQRRAAGAHGQAQTPPAPSTLQTLFSILPILVFFLMPLLSNLFSSFTSPPVPTTPRMVFDAPIPPLTVGRTTTRFNVPYYVEQSAVQGMSEAKLGELDRAAEGVFIKTLRQECASEQSRRDQMVQEAQGWFFEDGEKMEAARRYPMISCGRLRQLGISR